MRMFTGAKSLVACVVKAQIVVECSLTVACMVHWAQAAIIL